jgi:transcriptional regulator with XRE-family HTH domain
VHLEDSDKNTSKLTDTETDFSSTSKSINGLTGANISFIDMEKGEETIQRLLSSYELAKKLRQLRLKKKIALVDLGKHTGLSASMLSQLETGKMIPTLPTLARIAMVFDVGLDHFFDDRRRQKLFTIVRAQDRLRFPDRSDSPKPTYFFECLAFSAQGKWLQAYLAEFPRRDLNEVHDHFHEGSELIYILEGQLVIRYQDEEHLLREGDSVYFDSSEPHSYRGLSKTGSKAIVITVPMRQ